MTSSLLEVKGLTMRFQGLVAVSNFNLTLTKNELVGIIGPNGAGKTTVFNMLTGMYRPSEGVILLQDTPLNDLKPHHITTLGIARTFQNIRLFQNLSVLDNVRIGHHIHLNYGIVAATFESFYAKTSEQRMTEDALQLLKIFNLDGQAELLAKHLPYGAQRRLEILRALATHPKILLLDEPAAGLNHTETEALMETIHHIRKEFDLTILLIEHDMKLVMGICERLLVLDHGETIATGTPKEIQSNPVCIKAYLGEA
ncbi:MAG: ABC transporter ATP-binding protein [Deltaproteobacteria bacterium]|nr:ABC transporter ATP-binding protein [Deltaproteobacteria bacterium]